MQEDTLASAGGRPRKRSAGSTPSQAIAEREAAPAEDPCARDVLEAVPLVMRHIRAWMRERRVEGLGVPQFRTLSLLDRHPLGLTLGDVAEYLGLSPAGASRMIQSLVTKRLVARDTHGDDRRQLALTITPEGETILKANRRNMEEQLARRLKGLESPDRTAVSRAMLILVSVFAGDDPRGA